MTEKVLVIHDVPLSYKPADQISSFYAGDRTARCKGCFGCWLKTPGECVMHDGSEHIGSVMAQSKEVWIFSSILYGGFSMETKRVLDRCIPGVLPFFTWRHKRMHHCARYNNSPVFHIVFYNTETISEREKLLAEKIASAVSVNMNCSECSVKFVPGLPGRKEASDIENSIYCSQS